MTLSDTFQACLNIKDDESVLLLTDTAMNDTTEVIKSALKPLTKNLRLLVMKPRRMHGEELPLDVARAMAAADVVVGVTSKSVTHTEATKRAVKHGARVASMPGITVGMLTSGGMTADYTEVSKASRKAADILSCGKTVLIKTDLGTNFRADITGRKGFADTGLLTEKGVYGNLPGGEGFIAPVEGSSSGRLVFDGPIAGSGLDHDPIVVEVEDGRAVSTNYSALENIFKSIENSTNVAEIGVGTNPMARLSGNVLEDEKVLGTVHVAFGSNTSFGGSVDAELHLDGIIKYPTVFVDTHVIIKDGKPVF
ncbi:2,5-dihydroxypyridine 5,6-dioxygenase [archaeon BMS3Abin16]|nr:2,5-dihydroxypyridine 5,6-dioxygenase [archaeon BMS3Abin16]HDY74600.1 aminopeptidase [Euryarchaeota archaeon]